MIRLSKYGSFIISTGEIPASSDGAKLFPVFSSGDKCTEIQYVQYYGGDSGEYAQLILIPPTVVINGTTGTADHPGSIAICSRQYLAGGNATVGQPDTMSSDNGGRGPPLFHPFIVPPGYQIAVMQDTANTAAWVVTIGGFELDA